MARPSGISPNLYPQHLAQPLPATSLTRDGAHDHFSNDSISNQGNVQIAELEELNNVRIEQFAEARARSSITIVTFDTTLSKYLSNSFLAKTAIDLALFLCVLPVCVPAVLVSVSLNQGPPSIRVPTRLIGPHLGLSLGLGGAKYG